MKQRKRSNEYLASGSFTSYELITTLKVRGQCNKCTRHRSQRVVVTGQEVEGRISAP